MSLPLKKEYNEKLRDSFLNALLLGSFAPLDELNKRLKIEKNSFKIKPTPIMNGLEESMSNRGEDLRDASCIIKDARRKDLETALIPIENERHQRNPHRDNHLKLIKLTRDTINKLKKDPDLWCDRRAYTPKNNAKYIGYFSLSGAFLLVTAMLGVDFFVQTATPLSSGGIILSCMIGATAGALGAVRYNNEYHKHAKKGLRMIRDGLNPK